MRVTSSVITVAPGSTVQSGRASTIEFRLGANDCPPRVSRGWAAGTGLLHHIPDGKLHAVSCHAGIARAGRHTRGTALPL
jgi:hypothetical protein